MRRILRGIDFPIWAKPAGLSYRVCMRSVQHATYYLTSRGPEPEITALMCAIVKVVPVSGFLDVGANIGYYSWILPSQTDRTFPVHLFEPDTANIALIQRTLDRRGIPSKLHPIALAEQNGTLRFFRDIDSGHTGSLVHTELFGGVTEVPARRLDSVIDPHEFGSNLLIKIDVEGAEEQVLAGAETVLATQPIVMLECLHGADKCPSVFSKMRGYRMLDAVTAQPPTSSTTNYLAVPPTVSDDALEAVLRERDLILTKR